MSLGNSLLRVHIQKELPRGRIYLHWFVIGVEFGSTENKSS